MNEKNLTTENCKKLAQKYQTPLFVYDLDHISSQFNKIKDSLYGFKSIICYALKANSNLSVISHLAKLSSGADCVSINEVRRAILAGIPNYKIIFSGVGKQDFEIEEALKLNILFLNVESESELLSIESIASNLKINARISIRVNPDVDAKTHPYISTGLKENKFGVTIEDAKKLYIYAKKSSFLNPVGIHFHIGSQILEKDSMLEGFSKIFDLAKSLKALNIDLKFFDIGGGFGIPYKKEQSEFRIDDYLKEIVRKIDALDLTLICEPGRFIVGNAGYLISKVILQKQNHKKRFVVVDCAMNDLIRPSLYNAFHDVILIQDKESDEAVLKTCDIVGTICESGDYLAKDIELKSCNKGDLIIFKSAGAYCYSMSNNYNSRLKCPEVAIFKQNEVFFDEIIKERENFQDSVKNELNLLDINLPNNRNEIFQDQINFLRNKIDNIDNEIINLIGNRLNIVQKIGFLKNKNNSVVYKPDRENQIINRLIELGKNFSYLNDEIIKSIFYEIFSISRNLESIQRIAFLGPIGSYTHEASLARFGSISRYISLNSISSVFETVNENNAQYGVVPIENNTNGIVGETIDQLIDGEIKIINEISLPIHHCFVSKNNDLNKIKRIYSKDIAFGQCRNFLSFYNLQNVEHVNVDSTSIAANKTLLSDENAAICSQKIANIINVPIMFKNIEDNKFNKTRFFIISKNEKIDKQESITYKTSVFVTIKDTTKSGCLFELIKDFKEENINLAKIDSRPLRKNGGNSNFEFGFYIDFFGHIEDENIARLFLKRKNELKWLGSYPVNI